MFRQEGVKCSLKKTQETLRRLNKAQGRFRKAVSGNLIMRCSSWEEIPLIAWCLHSPVRKLAVTGGRLTHPVHDERYRLLGPARVGGDRRRRRGARVAGGVAVCSAASRRPLPEHRPQSALFTGSVDCTARLVCAAVQAAFQVSSASGTFGR